MRLDPRRQLEEAKRLAVAAGALQQAILRRDHQACFEGVSSNQFWIRPYLDDHQAMIQARTNSVIRNENPVVS